MPVAHPTPFGDYLLLDRIGRGGTAEIFRAVRRGRRPGEVHVAVKRMLPHLAQDAELAMLFLREIGALDRIDHPCVVRLLDHGEAGGLPFLVMPLLDGATLRRLMPGDAEGPVGRLAVGAALWLAAEVASGLHAAHTLGIVHRDVSPTNIQITADGRVMVLDFGIARVAGMTQTSHGGSLRGKWAYLSPEQIVGEPVDGRSDLFALGSVLVELLTGEPPFAGADPHDTMLRIQAANFPAPAGLPEAVAAPLDALLHRMLARSPADRPVDGATLATELRGLLACLTDAAEPDPWQRMLAEAVQALPAIAKPEVNTDAAELRGEQVTDPALDPDATQVRLDPGGGDDAVA